MMKRSFLLLMILTATLLCTAVNPVSASDVYISVNSKIGSVYIETNFTTMGLLTNTGKKCYEPGTYHQEYAAASVGWIHVKAFYNKGCGALLDKYASSPLYKEYTAPAWGGWFDVYKISVNDSDIPIHKQ